MNQRDETDYIYQVVTGIAFQILCRILRFTAGGIGIQSVVHPSPRRMSTVMCQRALYSSGVQSFSPHQNQLARMSVPRAEEYRDFHSVFRLQGVDESRYFTYPACKLLMMDATGQNGLTTVVPDTSQESPRQRIAQMPAKRG